MNIPTPTIRVLTTSPYLTAPEASGHFDAGVSVATHLVTTLRAQGTMVEFSRENLVSKGKCAAVVIVHNGPHEMLPSIVDEAKRIGETVYVSWCAPLPSPANCTRGTLLASYLERGQPREWLENECARTQPPVRQESILPIVRAALFRADSIQVWSKEAAELFSFHPSVKIISSGCADSKPGSPDIFVQQYGVSSFVLSVAPLRKEYGQLELLYALEKSDLPVVLIGTPSNEPNFASQLAKFRRPGRTIVITAADNELIESAIAACRTFYVAGASDVTGELALRAAVHGRNVVTVAHSATQELLEDSATQAIADDSNSIVNAVRAAFYAPFDAIQRERAVRHSWQSTAGKLATWALTAKAVPAPSYPPLRNIAVSTPGISPLPSSAPTKAPGLSINQACTEGESMLEKGSAAYAEEFFQFVLRSEPQNVRALKGLAQSYLSRELREQAYQCYVKITALPQVDLDIIVPFIGCAVSLARFDVLVGVLARYNIARPGNPDLNFVQAVCLGELGRTVDAIKTLQVVLQIAPDHRDAAEMLQQISPTHTPPAVVVTASGPRPPAPLNACCVSGNPIILNFVKEAIALRECGKVSEAQKLLKRALQCAPNDSNVNRELATCSAIGGNYTSAATLFEKAYIKNPHDGQALEGLLYSTRAAGTLPRLTDLLEKIMVKGAPDVEQRFTYAQCLVETGSIDRAKSQIEILRTVAPGDRRTRILQSVVGE